MAAPTTGNNSLHKMMIGISISDSGDLEKYHLSGLHVDAIFAHVAQQLLAEGATVAYGGDPTYVRSFSMLLADMAVAFTRVEDKARERTVHYLALPVALRIKPRERKSLETIMTLRDCFAASDQRFKRVPALSKNRPEDRPVLAGWYTQMRAAMQQDLHARIALGGKLTGYSGLCPGIAEEAVLAAEEGTALYLLGGYGGCARALADAAMTGNYPDALTEKWQLAHDPVLAQVDHAQLAPYFERLGARFGPKSNPLANNGLASEQNEELRTSRDPDRITQLLIQGLRKINRPKPLL